MTSLFLLIACGPGGVLAPGPVADIAITPASGPIPLTAILSGAGSRGDGLTYGWVFDDGSTATGEELAHTWLAAGMPAVELTVTDVRGRSGSAAHSIEVLPAQCPEGGQQQQLGQIASPRLTEISGVAASRQNPGVLWVHNDAGSPRVLYAVDESGALLAAFDVEVGTGDWEDIAVGTDDSGEHVLFIASVGNNNFDRETLAVLVVPEPEVPLTGAPDGRLPFHQMQVQYPSGTFDCEAMMWDPQTGDLLLVTKDADADAVVFHAAAPHDEDEVLLQPLRTLDFRSDPLSGGAVTSAAISPLGDRIAIRTYTSTVYVWRRDAGLPLINAFDTAPCPVEVTSETQAESIAFSLDGEALISVPEGANAPINRTALR